jgi:hypothetical protein
LPSALSSQMKRKREERESPSIFLRSSGTANANKLALGGRKAPDNFCSNRVRMIRWTEIGARPARKVLSSSILSSHARRFYTIDALPKPKSSAPRRPVSTNVQGAHASRTQSGQSARGLRSWQEWSASVANLLDDPLMDPWPRTVLLTAYLAPMAFAPYLKAREGPTCPVRRVTY